MLEKNAGGDGKQLCETCSRPLECKYCVKAKKAGGKAGRGYSIASHISSQISGTFSSVRGHKASPHASPHAGIRRQESTDV